MLPAHKAIRSLAFLLVPLVVASGLDARQDFQLAREDYPIVGGSTSTQPLGKLIAGRVTRTSIAWQRVGGLGEMRLGFANTPYDSSRTLVLDGKPPVETPADLNPIPSSISTLYERTSHHGTSQSFTRLANREADLVLTAREPTAEEREAIKKGGADVRVEPIARDAFVFIRHASNPVKGLTLDQVRDIYGGAITNWSALGGAKTDIVAYQRDASSGSQVEMEQVMKGRPMVKGPDIRMTYSMFGPFNALKDNPAGIGYSYHYYERYMAALPEVVTLAINGVSPDPSTIANGRYPLVTNVYLVHRSDLPAKSAAARLRDWLKTPAGQAVVAESGYVPLRR